MESIAKKDVFELICHAKQTMTLGLLIGSGFSKAVTNEHMPDWKTLLNHTANILGVDDIFSSGRPYPEVASYICRKYAETDGISIKESTKKFKYTIAKIINERPQDNSLEQFESPFNALSPNWIVTTNYDNIIELLIKGRAFPINPQDNYVKIADFIPVYHIHGSIMDPESIVITNDDYAHTLRVSDYRHARLPFLFKESTVLVLGYSLNDINVLSALDYSKNVYMTNSIHNSSIIQVIYSEEPNPSQYVSESGIIIIETNNLLDLLSEIYQYNQEYIKKIEDKQNEAQKYINLFNDTNQKVSDDFIKEKKYRNEIIQYMVTLEKDYWFTYSSYISFIKKCLGELWIKSSERNAFSFYKDILDIIIDLIASIDDYKRVPQVYVDNIVYWFSDISTYVGKTIGKSYAAAKLFSEREKEIPKEFIEEFDKRDTYDFNYSKAKELLEQKSKCSQ